MTTYAPELVEKYQLEYQKNPRSKVFAALAEAYRKMGLQDEALRICEQGVDFHPDFSSGRVAYARVLFDAERFPEALLQLEKALQISPDNLLAHSLMGDVHLRLRQPKEALKAFKMALFYNPQDQRAQQAVKKWEFLTADEYEDDLFAMQPVREVSVTVPLIKHEGHAGLSEKHELERVLSLADAYTVRDDLTSAIRILKAAKIELGSRPELDNRLSRLTTRLASARKDEATATIRLTPLPKTSESPTVVVAPDQRRRQVLESFLRRISQRRLTP